MTSIIRLTPISGAMGETPPCYLLQIDDFRFLLDTGWDEKFDSEFIAQLTKYVDKVDAVLLSHSDTYHLGALPYLIGKCGLDCPVYGTLPIWKMGQMFMYDCYLNHHNTREFSLFNLDDVDAAFDKIIQLEFGQSVALKGKGLGMSVTALPAGHSLGGTVWRISKTGEEDIYYAVEHNNKKERHLNGCEVERLFGGTERKGPVGVLITNAFNSLYVQEKRRKRDEMLLTVLNQTLRMGGNVLIATDTAGRSLELTLMLDQMWRMKDSGLAQYSLVFMNNVAFNVLEFAKSQVEWMSEKLQKAFESTRVNPFQLRNVILCHTLLELSQIPSPKVVVTSCADLESGFARDLFLQWCQDRQSSVVLTNRTSPGTLARLLIDEHCPGKRLTLDVKQKIKLEGKELEEYYLKRSNCTAKDNSSSEGRVFMKSNGVHQNNNLVKEDGSECVNEHDDEISIVKVNNGKNKFPDESSGNGRKRKFDDYGEIVDIEDFKENSSNSKKSKQQQTKLQRNKTESLSSDNADTEPPAKYICSKQTFMVNCMVHFIDFEGRSDVEALVKMIQEMQPQKLVLVRGTPQGTAALEALSQSLLPNTKIFKPGIGQVVDLTSGSQLLQVTLTDALMSRLEFQKLRGMELAWVDAEIDKTDTRNQGSLMFDSPLLVPCKPSGAATSNSKPSLPLSTQSHLPSTSGRASIFVNKLRLSEFKQILLKNGINSEYNSGVLQVKCGNGMVHIQKHPETKQLIVDGDGLTDEYYQIRSLLYQQFAIL